jgi:hypothetical protein
MIKNRGIIIKLSDEQPGAFLAHPQFLRKEPLAQKTAGRGNGKFMGFRVEEFGSSY